MARTGLAVGSGVGGREEPFFDHKMRLPGPAENFHDGRDFLKTAVPHCHWDVEKGGDGRLKFHMGFWRARPTDWVPEREERHERARTAFFEHDARRHDALRWQDKRNDLEVTTGHERGEYGDPFVSRGTRRIASAGAGPLRDLEEKSRLRNTGLRFFRPEEDVPRGSAAGVFRAATMAREGLVSSKRSSSLVGYARHDLPSGGVREALEGAGYGGERPASSLTAGHSGTRDGEGAGSLDGSTTLRSLAGASSPRYEAALDPKLNRSGMVGFSVWDAAHPTEEDVRRRMTATQRAPNRVFDTTSAPVVTQAVPDPLVRAMREERELLRSRGPRPADRPASLTAHATLLSSSRLLSTRRAEVDAVRALPD